MRLKFGIALGTLLALLITTEATAAVSQRVSDKESKAAARFWTPERAAVALKRDPVFGKVRTGSSGAPGGRPGSAGISHRPVYKYLPEVGKILGRDHLGSYSCSGSVIETRSLRLVLTAAHCLYYQGKWARKVLFIPNYKNGRRPFGTYRTKAMWVSSRWADRSFSIAGAHYDIGLIVTRRTWNGRRIGENVGALPIQTYPRRRGVTDIYGYPAGAMKGRSKRTCRSWTRPWSGGWFIPGPVGMKARCNLAPGSSGGPWISRYRYDDGTSVGVIDGLTSTGFRKGRRTYLTSPYFGRTLVRLIRATEGR